MERRSLGASEPYTPALLHAPPDVGSVLSVSVLPARRRGCGAGRGQANWQVCYSMFILYNEMGYTSRVDK